MRFQLPEDAAKRLLDPIHRPEERIAIDPELPAAVFRICTEKEVEFEQSELEVVQTSSAN